jgi:two-component system chemotaxis response regulator CheB
MTGMGSDGVEGMKEIKKAGGSTIAQDEKSSVVFGMNKMAIDNGIIDRVVPLDRIAAEIKNMVL